MAAHGILARELEIVWYSKNGTRTDGSICSISNMASKHQTQLQHRLPYQNVHNNRALLNRAKVILPRKWSGSRSHPYRKRLYNKQNCSWSKNDRCNWEKYQPTFYCSIGSSARCESLQSCRESNDSFCYYTICLIITSTTPACATSCTPTSIRVRDQSGGCNKDIADVDDLLCGVFRLVCRNLLQSVRVKITNRELVLFPNFFCNWRHLPRWCLAAAAVCKTIFHK